MKQWAKAEVETLSLKMTQTPGNAGGCNQKNRGQGTPCPYEAPENKVLCKGTGPCPYAVVSGDDPSNLSS